jgi:hypothetical protein
MAFDDEAVPEPEMLSRLTWPVIAALLVTTVSLLL